MGFQALLQAVYPAQCLTCSAQVTEDFALCGDCWRKTPFIGGLVCDSCGTPLPGTDDSAPVHCDDCLATARPWSRGRSAMLYRDNARNMVLALKHGDRLDLARPGGGWLYRAALPILVPDVLVAPVPLHWTRLFRRRYNQAALLSAALARAAGLDHLPDLLTRRKRTATQDGRGRDSRFANLAGAMAVTRRHSARLAGRHVLLVDDVLTSGATLAAAAEACLAGGAADVSVVALARVTRDG